MTRRTVVEREADRLVREMIGDEAAAIGWDADGSRCPACRPSQPLVGCLPPLGG